jgi:hypothetical protein
LIVLGVANIGTQTDSPTAVMKAATRLSEPLVPGVTNANLIARREETAAMPSQANTTKLLQDNPTLMRLRELEKSAHYDRRTPAK